MQLAEMKTELETALSAAESIIATAERRKSPFTRAESTQLANHRKTIDALTPQIEKAERASKDPSAVLEKYRAIGLGAQSFSRMDSQGRERMLPKRLSSEYREAFFKRVGNAGSVSPELAAALYEGTETGGGYAVPQVVDNYIAPLAPTASDIRSICTVIETTKEILLPTTAPTGLPTTTQTAELAAFAQSVPSLGQTQLQAYLNALLAPVSFELAQDAPGLEAWMHTVVEAALLEQEDALFVSGNGSNEPQGLIGNVGQGITAEPDGNSNLVSFAGLSALIGAVKAKYLAGSSFLMSQGTAIVARAALAYAGASTEWTRDADGTERLFGYRVAYSASMPSASRGNAPVLFGSFKAGYIVGDRGGSAVRLKVLDQMFGVNGTLYWLLYRRTDARVWVQEAIQQYNVAAS
jgi:HK97 family phage major capsid protein